MTPDVSHVENTDAQVLEASFAAPDFYSDIHAHYREFRETDPVHWSDTLGAWFLTGYADISAAHRDSRFSSTERVTKLLSRLPPGSEEQLTVLRNHYSGGLINSDQPEHTRMRKLFNKPFLRPAIAGLRPRIQTIVDELLDELEGREQIDLIKDFAYPLPIAVICDLLGVSIADRQSFLVWCHELSDVSAATGTLEGALAKQDSLIELRGMIREILAHRRQHPGDDMFSLLLNAQEEGDTLTEEEIVQSSVTLIIGSHETTTNLITNATYNLIRQPERDAELRANPELIEGAVEEFLRFDSSLNHNTRRAKTDIELHGRHIEEGQLVTMSLVAANRDPEQFPEPDRLDFARKPNNHIAFGIGPHFCLGAPLARAEGQLAINSLLRRFDHFELLREPEWRRNTAMHGLVSLELGL